MAKNRVAVYTFQNLERSNDMSRSPENSHVEGCTWAIEEGGGGAIGVAIAVEARHTCKLMHVCLV